MTTTQSESSLTIRLFNNPKFGNRIGPNRRNQIVLNGSVKFARGSMFIDLAKVANIDQVVSAEFPHMVPVLTGMAEKLSSSSQGDVLVGQLKFVEDNQREFVDGGIVVDLDSRTVRAFIRGDDGCVALNETLDLKRCRPQRNEQRSPDFIASAEKQSAAVSDASKRLAASILDDLG